MSYTEYCCGHKQDVVIINTTPETLSSYIEWKNNNPENICIRCWSKKQRSTDGSNKQ